MNGRGRVRVRRSAIVDPKSHHAKFDVGHMAPSTGFARQGAKRLAGVGAAWK